MQRDRQGYQKVGEMIEAATITHGTVEWMEQWNSETNERAFLSTCSNGWD